VRAVAAFLTVTGDEQIVDVQMASAPFAPAELAREGLVVTNQLVPEADPVGAAFAGRQLDLAIVQGPASGPIAGEGAVASFRVRCLADGVAQIRFDDNPVRETHYVDAAGAETLFALHGLLDRYAALDLPNGETVALRDDVRVFGTMNPTDLRDYAGTQTLNKAFADRWVIWEKDFPGAEQLDAMLRRRYPDMADPYVEAISRLATDVNASFEAQDATTRVETPLSLRSVLDRIPTGLRIHAAAADSLRMAWE